MDIKLQKALYSLQRSMAKRNEETSKPGLSQAVEETKTVEPVREEDIFKANFASLSPRDQQDLMAFPFLGRRKDSCEKG